MAEAPGIDPMFAAVAREIYGADADVVSLWNLSKAMPGTSDVSVPTAGTSAASTSDTRKRKALVGGLLFGAAAEGAAVSRAASNFTGPATVGAHRAATTLGALRTKVGGLAESKGGKAAELGLQAANFGVGLAAAKELVKKPPKTTAGQAISKRRIVPLPHIRPQSLVNADAHARRVGLRLVGATGVGAAAGGGFAAGRHTRPPGSRTVPDPTGDVLKKGFDLTWTGTISKLNSEKQQVFGWCSLSVVDGQPVVDLQGDYVPLDEIEKSAYHYVLHSRKGGDMHKRVSKFAGDLGPVHTADLIESFVVTPEKLEQMGLEPDSLPLGWWVGFKVNDEEQWDRVKRGERLGFSIHGKGTRQETVL